MSSKYEEGLLDRISDSIQTCYYLVTIEQSVPCYYLVKIEQSVLINRLCCQVNCISTDIGRL